ncbi:MAG: hypothetical protein JW726_10430 [Anaerolineales bacterium]|nr:hypothetical protein [Anaerolineales bacterium]
MSIYHVITSQRMSLNNVFLRLNYQARLAQFTERLLRRHQPLADFNHLPGIQSNSRTYKGLRDVALLQIKGSVNRKGDFDRRFRPLRKHLRDRWVNNYILLKTDAWPPVILYKVAEVYYVMDGHHRVSVAHATGMQYIQAEVWEYTQETKPAVQKHLPTPLPHAATPCSCKQSVVRM